MQEAKHLPEVWTLLHSEFHCEISRLSGYPNLHNQIQSLHGRLQPYLRLFNTAYANMELGGDHVELIDVLARRDAAQIAATMREHVWKAGLQTSNFAKAIGKNT
jgi:DNA-binding GntR family transcriptional regulator